MRVEREALVAAAEALDRELERRAGGKLATYFPDKGPYRRTLYPKHLSFFEAGAKHRERLLIAGNRIGKSDAGAYEATVHLTGLYPSWWKGHRFDAPVSLWAAGDTTSTTRDIIQEKLLGPVGAFGTGFLPHHLIIRHNNKRAVADAVETIWVRHASGGTSVVQLKAFDQKREAFQGTAQHLIWLDEEPDFDIYSECLLRTAKTSNFPGGKLMMTFTPLKGLTELVKMFLPGGESPRVGQVKFAVMASWDDAPHLSEDEKAELLAAMHPHQRAARTKGIPQLGAGIIYPVEEADITIDDFAIPAHWPRGYTLDIGWNRTAALWGAYNRESDQIVFYSAHYRGEAEPPVHAEAVKARGAWMPGRIDPAARGRSQKDGEQLIKSYIGLGLHLDIAPNAVESGIYECWTRLSTGRIKVFKSLQPFFEEFRVYRRDEKGRIVKESDHLMDDMRMFVLACVQAKPQFSWLQVEAGKALKYPQGGQRRKHFEGRRSSGGSSGLAWMG